MRTVCKLSYEGCCKKRRRGVLPASGRQKRQTDLYTVDSSARRAEVVAPYAELLPFSKFASKSKVEMLQAATGRARLVAVGRGHVPAVPHKRRMVRGERVCTQLAVSARDCHGASASQSTREKRTTINETAPVGLGHVQADREAADSWHEQVCAYLVVPTRGLGHLPALQGVS